MGIIIILKNKTKQKQTNYPGKKISKTALLIIQVIKHSSLRELIYLMNIPLVYTSHCV